MDEIETLRGLVYHWSRRLGVPRLAKKLQLSETTIRSFIREGTASEQTINKLVSLRAEPLPPYQDKVHGSLEFGTFMIGLDVLTYDLPEYAKPRVFDDFAIALRKGYDESGVPRPDWFTRIPELTPEQAAEYHDRVRSEHMAKLQRRRKK